MNEAIKYVKEELMWYKGNNKQLEDAAEVYDIGTYQYDGVIKICEELLEMLETQDFINDENKCVEAIRKSKMIGLDLTIYMSEELKNNPNFILKLLQEEKSLINNPNIIGENLRNDVNFMEQIENLKNDSLYMRLVISKDPSAYKSIGEKLKNDPNFIRKIFKDSYDLDELEKYLDESDRKTIQKMREEENFGIYKKNVQGEIRKILKNCPIKKLEEVREMINGEIDEKINQSEKTGDEER